MPLLFHNHMIPLTLTLKKEAGFHLLVRSGFFFCITRVIPRKHHRLLYQRMFLFNPI